MAELALRQRRVWASLRWRANTATAMTPTGAPISARRCGNIARANARRRRDRRTNAASPRLNEPDGEG
jgi:hypothetical protein